MTTSISNRCERNTATPMDSGMSIKDNAKPTLRSSSGEGRIPADQREAHRQLKREGSRHTQGRAEHNPLSLLPLRWRGDPDGNDRPGTRPGSLRAPGTPSTKESQGRANESTAPQRESRGRLKNDSVPVAFLYAPILNCPDYVLGSGPDTQVVGRSWN